MEDLKIITLKNPFDRSSRELSEFKYDPNATLLDLRMLHFPSDVQVKIAVNGHIVPFSEWDNYHLAKGDQVLFTPTVGDSDFLRTALMMAVVAATLIVAPELTFAAFTGLGLGGAGFGLGTYFAMQGLFTVGLMYAGGALINHFLPPQTPSLPTVDGLDGSRTYGWNPVTTQTAGIPVPVAYGMNRLSGNIITAYRTHSGDVDGSQYLNVNIALCQGPVSWIGSYSISDVPVTQEIDSVRRIGSGLLGSVANAVVNLLEPKDIDIRYSLGKLVRSTNTTGQAIDGFIDTTVEHNTSPFPVKVTNTSTFTYTVPGNVYDYLEVDVAFPSGVYYLDNAGNLSPYNVKHRIEVGTGTTPGSWWSISKAPAFWGSSASGYWSYGKWLNIEGEQGYTIGQVWSQTGTGSTVFTDHKDGEKYNTGSYFSWPMWVYTWRWIQSDPNEDPAPYVSSSYDYYVNSYSTRSPITLTYRTDRLTNGTYSVRVANLLADQTDLRYSDDMYVTAVREIYSTDYQYPRLATVAVKIRANDMRSGGFNFTAMVCGKIIKYYNGATWATSATDNPAWVCYDILTQPVLNDSLVTSRYDGIDPSYIDYQSFYDWATFCDSGVPDGKGGTEKRVTFNGVFDTAMNVWDAAMKVCQVGRAALVWTGSKLTAVVDKPVAAVQLFTMGNINTDTFEESFLNVSERSSEVRVDFANRDLDYKRDSITVFNPSLGWNPNPATIELFGITKYSEAYRAAMYRLFCNQYITRFIKFDTDIEAIACQVGDVINVQHDSIDYSTGTGGRIVSSQVSTITLDKYVTVAAGKTYFITTKNSSNDVLQQKTVLTGVGSWNVLAISGTFAPVPAQYDVYAFGEQNISVRQYRITGISKSSDHTVSIQGAEYNDLIYSCDSASFIPSSAYLELPPPVVIRTMPNPVTALNLTQSPYLPGDIAYYPKVTVTYAPDQETLSTYQSAHIYYYIERGAQPLTTWVSYGYDYSMGMGYVIDLGTQLSPADTLHVAVLVVSNAGQEDSWSNAVTGTVVIGSAGQLTNITSLTLEGGGTVWNGLGFAVKWDAQNSLDPFNVINRVSVLIPASGTERYVTTVQGNNRWEYNWGQGSSSPIDVYLPQSSGSCSVRVRRESPITAASSWTYIHLSNAAPAAPQNLVGVGLVRGASFTWNPCSEADFSQSLVRSQISSSGGPGATWTNCWYIWNTQFQRPLSDIEVGSWGDTAKIFLEVSNIDMWGNKSSPASTNADAEAVTAVVSFDVAGLENPPNPFNILPNGDLQQQWASWKNTEASTGVIIAVSDPILGAYCFQNTTSYRAGIISATYSNDVMYFPINRRSKYEAAGWFRAVTSGTTGIGYMQMTYYTSSKDLIGTQDVSSSTWRNLLSWEYKRGELILPNSASYMTFKVYTNANTITPFNGSSVIQAQGFRLVEQLPAGWIYTGPDGYNLALNGDFENGTDGWNFENVNSNVGSVTLATYPKSGKYAFTNAVSGAGIVLRSSKYMAVTSDRTYSLEGWASKTLGTNLGTMELGVTYYTSANSYVNDDYVALFAEPPAGGPTFYQGVFGYNTNHTIPNSACYMKVRIGFTGPLIGQIQGIRLRECIESVWIRDAAITSAKIGSLAVGSAHIQYASIGSAHIAEATIGAAKIIDLDAEKIKAGNLDAVNLAAGSFVSNGSFLVAPPVTEIGSWAVINGNDSPLTWRGSDVTTGSTTITVEDTTGFPNSWSAVDLYSTYGGGMSCSFAYTGKTATSLTGCTSVTQITAGIIPPGSAGIYVYLARYSKMKLSSVAPFNADSSTPHGVRIVSDWESWRPDSLQRFLYQGVQVNSDGTGYLLNTNIGSYAGEWYRKWWSPGHIAIPCDSGSTLHTMAIHKNVGELKFFAPQDHGNTGIPMEILSIGLRPVDNDEAIMKIGSEKTLKKFGIYSEIGSVHPGYGSAAICGVSSYSIGVRGVSWAFPGVSGENVGTDTGTGVKGSGRYGMNGISTCSGGCGVWGDASAVTGGEGGVFEGTRCAIRLVASGASGLPSHNAFKGSLWVDADGILYINTNGSTGWAKVGGQ